jgi:hypothetical protein
LGFDKIGAWAVNQSVWDENDVAIFFGLFGTSKLSSPWFMRQVFRPILFGIIFAMQNSTVVQVRFLIWSVQMSQALAPGSRALPVISSISPSITDVLLSSCKVAICWTKRSGLQIFCTAK